MKMTLIKKLVITLFAASMATQSIALDRQQKDTVVGAVIGGAAGAVIGNDMTSTVAGAALGGVVGSQWNDHKRSDDRKYKHGKSKHKSERYKKRHNKHKGKKHRNKHSYYAYNY